MGEVGAARPDAARPRAASASSSRRCPRWPTTRSSSSSPTSRASAAWSSTSPTGSTCRTTASATTTASSRSSSTSRSAAVLPDVAVTVPDYVTIARIDPDRKGIRFGLRTTLNVNHLEAGEKLFIDLMPQTWQGLPPGLPPDRRRGALAARRGRGEARRAAAQGRGRAAAQAGRDRPRRPQPDLRPRPVQLERRRPRARSPSRARRANLDFDWPVPIDLYALKADLPPELLAVENSVSPDGSRDRLHDRRGRRPALLRDLADRVRRRHRHRAGECRTACSTLPTTAASAGPLHAAAAEPVTDDAGGARACRRPTVAPYVTVVGSTVRLVFPFERDVAAAVFRRGDSVWMLFDTAGQRSPSRRTSRR